MTLPPPTGSFQSRNSQSSPCFTASSVRGCSGGCVAVGVFRPAQPKACKAVSSNFVSFSRKRKSDFISSVSISNASSFSSTASRASASSCADAMRFARKLSSCVCKPAALTGALPFLGVSLVNPAMSCCAKTIVCASLFGNFITIYSSKFCKYLCGQRNAGEFRCAGRLTTRVARKNEAPHNLPKVS